MDKEKSRAKRKLSQSQLAGLAGMSRSMVISIKTGWGGVIMKNILIIDDDVHIGNVLEEALTKEGYGVFRAYSGTEALFVLAGGKIDLVLLDLMLPGLNGEEILPQIK